jgi:hypothetical protein
MAAVGIECADGFLPYADGTKPSAYRQIPVVGKVSSLVHASRQVNY